jgi:hypothetical protein
MLDDHDVLTSLVTASKERQTGAKSCKAGKLHSADEIISFTLPRGGAGKYFAALGAEPPRGLRW